MLININLQGAGAGITSFTDLGRVLGGVLYTYGANSPSAAKKQLDILAGELRQASGKADFIALVDAMRDGVKEIEDAARGV